jgi:hypothetical protein
MNPHRSLSLLPPGGGAQTFATRRSRYPMLLLRQISEMLSDIRAEIRRINHAGIAPATLENRSRRECARMIKAALAERYHEHNRCC